MSDPVIEVEHLHKIFCKDLRRSLWYGVKDLGRELFLRDRAERTLRRDEFYALKDVSFQVRPGETLGVIGHNGSGKSTLLKLINGLIKPSGGKITIRGRVGALIELGAGFNPVLTGRENVYVNGAVLGFTKREIDARLDEIVEFAEIGEFMDAPVQTYSSGMRVRLGFAIASTIDPDLLLIDEILSVGDASFREKSYSRLMDFKRRGGTLIFVSHNPAAVETVSDRVMLLDHGDLVEEGEPQAVIYRYQAKARKKAEESAQKIEVVVDPDDLVLVSAVRCCSLEGEPREALAYGEPFLLEVEFDTTCEVQDPRFWLAISKGWDARSFLTVSMLADGVELGRVEGKGKVTCRFEVSPLTPGEYDVVVGVQRHISEQAGRKHYAAGKRLGRFTVDGERYLERYPSAPASKLLTLPPIDLDHSWDHSLTPAGGEQ
jgi:homopolymeric O-antigen transport system ATP-binding protein